MRPEKLEREVQVRNLSGEQREQLMIQVAKRYYQLDMTMGQLSEELGLTRWQASRLLTEAKETGLVRIEIVPHTPRLPKLESQLQRKFDLKDAVVVPGNAADDAGMALDGVARAAGQFLAGLGTIPSIGVSWGRTMLAVANRLPPFVNENLEVVLLNGAINVRSSGPSTNNVAELFARSAKGTAVVLPVPGILGHAATREALEQDPTIANVLELGRKVPVICFGLGALTPDSVLIQAGYATLDDFDRMRKAGAVGDILGRYIDASGAIVDPDFDNRTIGAHPESCRGRDYSIAVAMGAHKRDIILSCLNAGYANVLITDQAMAESLL